MFGRGKKKAEPVVPWVIQVLTTEYLVEGSVLPDDNPFMELRVLHRRQAFTNGF